MTLLLLVASAALFALSAGTKLADRSGTRLAVGEFGVPRRLTTPVAHALVLGEAATAVLLATYPAVGAGLGLLLLGAVSATVAWALMHGRHPECHCFGRLSRAPVSARTLVRNAVMAVMLVVLLVRVADGDMPSQGEQAVLPLAAAGLLLAACVVAVDGGAGRRRPEVPSAGRLDDQSVLRIAVRSTSGRLSTALDLRRAERPLVLVFLSPGCSGCLRLAPEIARWRRMLTGQLDVVAVVAGDRQAASTLLGDADELVVLLDDEERLAGACDLHAYPAAVLVEVGDGLVGPRYGPAGAASLVVDAVHAAAPRAAAVEDLLDERRLLQWSPAHRPGVETHPAADGGASLLDVLSGATLHLDALGAVVWECLDGGTTVAGLADELATAFRAPVEVVTADVLKMTQDLAHQGMLWGVPALVGAGTDGGARSAVAGIQEEHP